MGMLVISRKIGQGVKLFDKETGKFLGRIMYVSNDRGKLRLGFQFDSGTIILRDELCDGQDLSAYPADQVEGIE